MKLKQMLMSGTGPMMAIMPDPFAALRTANGAIIIPFVGGAVPVQTEIVVSSGGTEIYRGDAAAVAAQKAGAHVEQSVLRRLEGHGGPGGNDRLAAMREIAAAVTGRLQASGQQCFVLDGSDSFLNLRKEVRPMPDGSFSLQPDSDGKFFLTPDPDNTDDLFLVLELDASDGDPRLEGVDPGQIIAQGNTTCSNSGTNVRVIIIRVSSGSHFLIRAPEGGPVEGDIVRVSWDGVTLKAKTYTAVEWNVYTRYFQGQTAATPQEAGYADSAPPPPADSEAP